MDALDAVRSQTHPFQKIVDPTGEWIGTGCMRCGLLLASGLGLFPRLPPCEAVPVQPPTLAQDL